MTPIARLLARVLPAGLVVPALALVYAAMIIAVLMAGDAGGTRIVYVDVSDR